jgi:predicted MFS family arabinose efflux permease
MESNPKLQPGALKTFAALSYPNYRLWFFGQMISLFGTWMQSTAQGYLVYEITRSPAYLGYVGFASGIATWVFTLWGGVVADRMSRRALLVTTQSLSMLLAFILSALTFARVVAPWHIVFLAFCLGVVNAFDAPARQAFVLEMVERRDLTNAIALNSTMFNMAIAVGPAVGGVTYALFGPGWCFAINGVSFLAVIAALLAMRLTPKRGETRRGSVVRDIREGVRTVLSNRLILAVIALLGVVSLFGMSFATLIPAWAVQVLGGDSRTNGLLQSARGVGALFAALGIATFVTHGGRGRVLTAGSLLFPVMLLVFSFTRSLPLSLTVLLTVGACNITVNNLCNSLVQTLTPDAVRGRVMGIYTLIFFGFMPIGALIAGALASRIGEPLTVAAGALVTLVSAAAIAVIVPGLRKQE